MNFYPYNNRKSGICGYRRINDRTFKVCFKTGVQYTYNLDKAIIDYMNKLAQEQVGLNTLISKARLRQHLPRFDIQELIDDERNHLLAIYFNYEPNSVGKCKCSDIDDYDEEDNGGGINPPPDEFESCNECLLAPGRSGLSSSNIDAQMGSKCTPVNNSFCIIYNYTFVDGGTHSNYCYTKNGFTANGSFTGRAVSIPAGSWYDSSSYEDIIDIISPGQEQDTVYYSSLNDLANSWTLHDPDTDTFEIPSGTSFEEQTFIDCP